MKYSMVAVSVVVISIVLLFSACAARKDIIIDTHNVHMDQYQHDLADCKQVAEQVDTKVVGSALGGALVGGVVGGIVGNKRTAQKLSAVGAVSGGARGARATQQEKLTVTKNCLRNRGYVVLN